MDNGQLLASADCEGSHTPDTACFALLDRDGSIDRQLAFSPGLGEENPPRYAVNDSGRFLLWGGSPGPSRGGALQTNLTVSPSPPIRAI